MTDLVFVNTSKQVGDADHIKMLTNRDAAETCFEENDPEGGGRLVADLFADRKSKLCS